MKEVQDQKRVPFAFFKKYRLIADTDRLTESNFGGKKHCRFCGRNDDEVSFNGKAHLFPEFLGKHNILNNAECDECNRIFGRYETDLATFLSPFLTFIGTRNKRGKIPKFESRRSENQEKTKVERDKTQNAIYVNLGKNLVNYQVDEANQICWFTFRRKPYIPLNVYKALAKIGIALLPEHKLGDYPEICHFLINETTSETGCLPVIETLLKHKYFSKPRALLYEAKSIQDGQQEYPDCVLILMTGNLVIQTFLPPSYRYERNHYPENGLTLETYPAFGYDELYSNYNNNIQFTNLVSSQKMEDNLTLSFTFSEIQRNVGHH